MDLTKLCLKLEKLLKESLMEGSRFKVMEAVCIQHLNPKQESNKMNGQDA